MESIKFIHCADIHLDMPFSYFGLQNEKSRERRNDLRQIFKSICEIAKKQQVDFILICGDLYENKYVSKDTILFINEIFKQIEPIKVLIIPGNHDPYINNCYYNNFNWASNTFIFNQDNFVYRFENKNVNVYGSGFSNFYEANTLLKMNDEILQKKNNFINILGIHATVDLEFANILYNPIKSEEIDELDMDYVALGHIHKRINEIGRKKNIYYCGVPEPLKFGDNEICGINIVKIRKENNKIVERTVDFIKTNKRIYKNIDIIIDEMNSDDIISDSIINKLINDNNYRKNHYIITLKGKCDKERNIDVDYIMEKIHNKVFYCKVVNKTEFTYDLDSLKNEKGLKGIFVKKALARISTAEGDEKELLIKALYFGLEVLDNGKLDIGIDI